jgi:uncharacterized membrane protein
VGGARPIVSAADAGGRARSRATPERRARPASSTRHSRRGRTLRGHSLALVAGLAVLYALLFLAVSKARFDRFAFRDQDLALNAQALWVLLHGSMHVSIYGVSFLGNHLQWATFVLAPLYALWSSPMLLLAAQTLALAAGPFPLYRIAERRLGPGLGVAVVAAYLLCPALGYVNLSEFHMPSLVVPLLLCAHDAYETDRRGRLIALLAAVALVQENFPLFGVAYGVLLAWKRRDAKRGLLLAAGCLAYFYVGIEVVMPAIWREVAEATGVHAGPAVPGTFPGLGRSLPTLIGNFARNPAAPLLDAYEPRKALWLAQLLLPLALLPLAGIEWLLPAAPYFLQHFLSARENETALRSHYAAEMIPFVFIATVVGLARVRAFLPRALAAPLLGGALLAATLVGNVLLGCQLHLARDLAHAHEAPPDPLRRRLLAMVPADASVVASFDVLPHLVNRHRLYTLDHVARGALTRARYPFRLPPDTQYALVDWTDDVTFRKYSRAGRDLNLARAFADGSWRVVHAEGTVTLLERARAAAGGEPAVGAGEEPGRGGDEAAAMPARPFAGETQLFAVARAAQGAGPSAPVAREPLVLADGALELVGSHVVSAPARSGDPLRVRLAWRARATPPSQYLVRIELLDTQWRAHASTDHPICYNIFPPTRWAIGDVVEEDVWLPAPSPIPAGDYAIAMRIGAYLEPRPVPLDRLSDGAILTKDRAIVAAWRRG